MAATPDPAELDLLANYANLVLRLYTNSPDPESVTSQSDFVEADFDGYAPVDPLGCGAPEESDDASMALLESPPLTFTKSEGDQPNTVTGYFLCLQTTVGEILVGACPFYRQIEFAAEGDSFSFSVSAKIENLAWAA